MMLAAIVVLGLCMGSFVEAAVWRAHAGASSGKLSQKRRRELSMLHGRSMCAHCSHQLAWFDLIPLLSWLSLAGKCRYCRKPIGWQAPLLELMTAGLFVISYLNWPMYLSPGFGMTWVAFGLWLSVLVWFVYLSTYDLRWMLLPNKAVLGAIVSSVALWVAREVTLGFELMSALNVIGAVAVLAGLFWALYQVSDGQWIGGGDVKLAVALGILAGEPVRAFLVLFIASLLGSIIGVTMALKARSRQLHVPFGPFLMGATVIVYLFGGDLIEWYVRTLLG
jgi:prepilin signal peptidase PulO-like enzyme (type II secretory pathway)